MTRAGWIVAAAMLAGCSPKAVTPEASSPAPAAEPEPAREPFRVLSPDELVPEFRVRASDGTLFDSDALVGKRPFVVVFYATWCSVCEMKLPVVKEALSRASGRAR